MVTDADVKAAASDEAVEGRVADGDIGKRGRGIEKGLVADGYAAFDVIVVLEGSVADCYCGVCVCGGMERVAADRDRSAAGQIAKHGVDANGDISEGVVVGEADIGESVCAKAGIRCAEDILAEGGCNNAPGASKDSESRCRGAWPSRGRFGAVDSAGTGVDEPGFFRADGIGGTIAGGIAKEGIARDSGSLGKG